MDQAVEFNIIEIIGRHDLDAKVCAFTWDNWDGIAEIVHARTFLMEAITLHSRTVFILRVALHGEANTMRDAENPRKRWKDSAFPLSYCALLQAAEDYLYSPDVRMDIDAELNGYPCYADDSDTDWNHHQIYLSAEDWVRAAYTPMQQW